MNSIKKKCLPFLLALLSGMVFAGTDAENLGQNQESMLPANPSGLSASPETVQNWRDLKFGLFITWGPVSLIGKEIGWWRDGDGGFRGRPGGIPAEVYDNLYRSFYPADFDADEWMWLAKDAGIKYVVFTTKHHAGFCMWDSQYTGWDMGATPYGRDIVRELADACHKTGIGLGLYYSHWDWCHPFYRTERHNEYLDYMRNHLRELTENYGPIMEFWFDGSGPPELWDAENMVRLIRERQPRAMINERMGLFVDFQTREGGVGPFDRSHPWESEITLCGQWAWGFNLPMLSFETCIQHLVNTVGGDGNLLLNVGPMPTGRIEPRQQDRLREIGHWLKTYGFSIYNTRGGPFKPGFWGASTHRDNTVFLHILNKEQFTGKIPLSYDKVKSCSLQDGTSVPFHQRPDGIAVVIPPEKYVSPDTLLEIQLTIPASEIPVQLLADRGFLPDKILTSSTADPNEHPSEYLADGDIATAWWSSGDPGQTIQLIYPEPILINSVRISESGGRVLKFVFEYLHSDEWIPLFESNRMRSDFEQDFDPVTTSSVRIRVLDFRGHFRINEIQTRMIKKGR